MKKILSLLFIFFVSFSFLLKAEIKLKPKFVFNLNYEDMLSIKKDMKQGNTFFKEAYHKLILQADSILQEAPLKVTDGAVPPTGDIHDFFTIGKYAFPNPDTADGMPYIRKDGMTNPEARGEKYDLYRYEQTVKRVNILSLAWFYSENEEYAKKAAELLRVWFLNPETRMNPNFLCAAALPGVYDGHPIGIIFGAQLVNFLDHIQLLNLSDSWTDTDNETLKKWFDDYTCWLLTSNFGVMESRGIDNNHGTWYLAQIAASAIYNNKTELAKSMIDRAKLLMDIQIAKNDLSYPDGCLPKEIRRNQSFLYSLYGLEGFCALAGCGDAIKYDLWHFETPNGKSLKLAFDFLVPYLLEEKTWPYLSLKNPQELFPSSLHLVRMAAKTFRTKELMSVEKHIQPYAKDYPYILLESRNYEE